MMVLFLMSCDNVECMRLAQFFLVFLQPKTFKYKSELKDFCTHYLCVNYVRSLDGSNSYLMSIFNSTWIPTLNCYTWNMFYR